MGMIMMLKMTKSWWISKNKDEVCTQWMLNRSRCMKKTRKVTKEDWGISEPRSWMVIMHWKMQAGIYKHENSFKKTVEYQSRSVPNCYDWLTSMSSINQNFKPSKRSWNHKEEINRDHEGKLTCLIEGYCSNCRSYLGDTTSRVRETFHPLG